MTRTRAKRIVRRVNAIHRCTLSQIHGVRIESDMPLMTVLNLKLFHRYRWSENSIGRSNRIKSGANRIKYGHTMGEVWLHSPDDRRPVRS